jgi:prolyl oligopeptidase
MGRVVSIPVDSADDRSTWTEVIPEGDRVVWSVGAAADTLVVGLVDDSGQELRLFSRDGSPRGRVGLEPGAVASAESVLGRGITPCPGGFVFWHNAFTSLSAAYRYDLGDATLSTIVPAVMEPDLELRVLDCRSADGVGLRVRLMHRPGLDVSTPRPLLLSGYGNLNQVFVNPAEAYGAFLDAGGVFAWATIPGGGEFGSSWWRMANQENMGRRGHDLASVAEFLIEKGHTTSAQLAIIGGSGGGVLTSMAITERPDLYRAAAILFPQTDFARYIHEPYGRAWVASEWGDPENPDLAPVIRKWSPYHNVKPGEHYPATLFFVGTEDGICPPWHSRKLAAALQTANASQAPILIRVIPGFGHAVGEPEAVAALAREPLAFVMRMLGMNPDVSMNEGERA